MSLIVHFARFLCAIFGLGKVDGAHLATHGLVFFIFIEQGGNT